MGITHNLSLPLPVRAINGVLGLSLKKGDHILGEVRIPQCIGIVEEKRNCDGNK